AGSTTLAIGRYARSIVIHGRSKERSDAAQTRGSMPRLLRCATVQYSAPLHSSARVTAWIPGSPRRSFAPASPWYDDVWRLRPNPMLSLDESAPLAVT
ncbi:hypothetical protein EN811_30500, partial [bacterium M00.F.Ca.ET.168.01.1.1]